MAEEWKKKLNIVKVSQQILCDKCDTYNTRKVDTQFVQTYTNLA